MLDTNTFSNSEDFKGKCTIETRGFYFGTNRSTGGKKSWNFAFRYGNCNAIKCSNVERFNTIYNKIMVDKADGTCR